MCLTVIIRRFLMLSWFLDSARSAQKESARRRRADFFFAIGQCCCLICVCVRLLVILQRL